MFGGGRDDLPDARIEDTKPTLGYFFKLLGRKFWKLITLNFMMLPLVIPLLLALIIYLGIGKTPSAKTEIFSPLYGVSLIEQTSTGTLLLDLFGGQYQIPAYSATGTYIGIGACILFLAVTFGWQNVGATYVLRGLVRGDPVFPFSDYFYAIKRNFKQGFFLGLLDFLILFLLGYDILYFFGMTGTSFWINVMFYASTAIALLYLFMRMYIYLLQVTFNLSIRKILKNALIFTTLGVKRNLMAALGLVLLAAANIGLVLLLTPFNAVSGLPFVLPMLYLLAVASFITTYAAYPIIDRYMIAPFRKPEEDTETGGTEFSEEEAKKEDATAPSSNS